MPWIEGSATILACAIAWLTWRIERHERECRRYRKHMRRELHRLLKAITGKAV